MDARTTYESLFIDGAWRPSHQGETRSVVNPATAEVIGQVPEGDAKDADAAIAAARRAFDDGPWPRMDRRERAARMTRFLEVLIDHRGDLRSLVMQEAGSLRQVADAYHLDLAFARFEQAIDLARSGLDTTTPLSVGPGIGGKVLGGTAVLREPVGVVAAITPFNFPLSLNLVKLGPALAAGNTAILKPAPLTPLEGLVLGAAAAEADLPPGVLNVVTGDRQAGEALVVDGRVDMVSFTGSDATGSAVMALASGTLKRLVLELGGKSALIVRADADVAAAAENGFRSFTTHAGQGCSLLTRHVVHRAVADEFVGHLRQRAMATVVGDPLDPATTMGPLISGAQRTRVGGLVEVGAAEGGTVAVGGRALERPGYYYEPTVITDVDQDMRVAQEEIFGPVAVVISFDTDDEAVRIANNSRFGLSGAIYSRDVGTAYEMARRLRTGQVRINGGGTAPDLDAPMMGRKASGMGAEYGLAGLLEFTQLKSVGFRAG